MNIIYMMLQYIQNIGMYGHLIMFMIVSFHFFQMKSALWGYWLGSFANEMLNQILKKIVKEPRPVLITDDENAHDYYGMPSGHVQHAMFSIIFVGLMKPNVLFMMGLCVLMSMSIYERLVNDKHTVWQIIVGGLVGLIMSGIVYTMTKKYWTTKDFELSKIYE
jgi:membrane-associated phospholipid phosphatase